MSGASLLVKPAYQSVPDYYATRGDQVADLAVTAHYAPMPEQRLVLDGMFAVDREGRSVAFGCCCIACRQNLKTGAFKMAGLAWLFLERDLLIVWSAHQWDTVSEAFLDFDDLMSGCQWLRRRVRYVRRGERDQEIGTVTGSRMIFKTRTKGGGRGLAGDKVVLDEAYAVLPAHMGSLVPTMAARSLFGNPQLCYGSSAARTESGVLRGVVARGRAGNDPSLVYWEWCAPPPAVACDLGDRCDHGLTTRGCGCDKPELVRLANPAVGRLISLDYILTKERRELPPDEYGRERMGWHDAGEEDTEVIPLADWADAYDAASEPAGRVAISVVYSAKRERAAVGLCGRRSDGLLHVELAQYRPGTGWCRGWVKLRAVEEDDDGEPQDKFIDPLATAIDGHGHEKTLIPDLVSDGVDVTVMNGGDVAEAFGNFFDAVTDSHTVRHRGQDALTLALVGATTRDIGDAGTAWARRKSGVDISPVVAVSQAMWAFLANEPEQETEDEPGVWVL